MMGKVSPSNLLKSYFSECIAGCAVYNWLPIVVVNSVVAMQEVIADYSRKLAMNKSKNNRICPICKDNFLYFCLKCFDSKKITTISNHSLYMDRLFGIFKNKIEQFVVFILNIFSQILSINGNSINNDRTTIKIDNFFPIFQHKISPKIIHQTTNIIINFPHNGEFSQQDRNKVVQILKTHNTSEDSETTTISNMEIQTCKKKSLFASLMKRKKPADMKIQEIETFSAIKFESETMSITSSESTRTNTELSAGDKSKSYGFFRKIIKRSKSSTNNSQSTMRSDSLELKNGNSESSFFSRKALINNFISTTYTPKCDLKLINGINELQDILQNLYKSEEQMYRLLKKHIEDKTFKKQLLQSSYEYFSLQFTSKSQTATLANGLWKQQLELTKIQENTLQKKLNFAIKQNRLLQGEIESLCRTCEKFAAKADLYPKRFLQMKSFGKTYAKHLIENNRKLQLKMKSLMEMIEHLEGELQKVQRDNNEMVEEKLTVKSKLYNIEAMLDRCTTDLSFEKTAMNNQRRYMRDCEQASRFLLQDLTTFERQCRDLAIEINFPKLSHSSEEQTLQQLIYLTRKCVEEIVTNLITAYSNACSVIKDMNKLRDTNSRLQENLRKSTSELDNLSKKLELNQNTIENKEYEGDLLALKMRLDASLEENSHLKIELEKKNQLISDSNGTINSISMEKKSLQHQIDDLNATINQILPKMENVGPFQTPLEKLEMFKSQYAQILLEKNYHKEKISNLEEENRNLLKIQQESDALQDGLSLLSAENDLIKKQLANEHQTVTTLQNERIKYLEEKTILRAIFQHLKSEISRIQQLENTVTDMSKETSRLALIAEFNKQLGEQLKSEVELKENTILELRQNMEKLSHLQLDNDKEKMTLCAQLNQVANVKEQLSDCLEMELKKNFELDETKKKLETTTKSQLKLYEEMQKNERAALRELLKDFKLIVKQRDGLLKVQEDSVEKNRELEMCLIQMKKQYEIAMGEIEGKNVEIGKMVEKLHEQEELLKHVEEKNTMNSGKFEKTLKKLEKLVGQLRKERDEFENSNVYLKTNLQKVDADLNESRQRETEAKNNLMIKNTEIATLERELSQYRNNLQELSHDNGKLNLELDFLRKMFEHLQNTIQQFTTKETMEFEAKTSVGSRDQECGKLNKIIAEKSEKIQQLQLECDCLKKQTEDQNRIMMGYEDQLIKMPDLENAKFNLTNDLQNLQIAYNNLQIELQQAKIEIGKYEVKLKKILEENDHQKTFYKNQTEDLILQYSEQKDTIEVEIGSISQQLREVTRSLQIEKCRFEELSANHQDLSKKFVLVKESLNAEIGAHEQTCTRLSDVEMILKNMEIERDNLQREIHLLVVDLNEEKAANVHLTKENERVQRILEQGRQQYNILASRCIALETEASDAQLRNKSESDIGKVLNEKSLELQSANETIECLQRDFEESQKALFELKEDYFNLQQQVTGLEFKNCELTLQLHEVEGRLETERSLHEELKSENEKNLEKIFKLEEGLMAPSEPGDLFY